MDQDLAIVICIIVLVFSILISVWIAIRAYRRGKVLKNTVPDNCVDCNVPMKYHSMFMYMWKCPECGKRTLLLLDNDKNLVKAEYGSVSKKRKILIVLIIVLLYTAIFVPIALGEMKIAFIVMGLMMVAFGIMYALVGTFPKKTEYDEKFLNSVELKHSLEKMRLVWCGLFMLFATLLFCIAFNVDFVYQIPLIVILAVYLVCLFYVLEHNVKRKKKIEEL